MPGMMRAGHGLMLIALTLLTIGVVMVNSAGLSVDPNNAITLRDVLLGRPTILAAMAAIMLFIGMHMPTRKLYELKGAASPIPWIILGSIVLLLLVHVPGLGREVNGAKRWLALGPIGFQPSEVAKWGLIIVLAWHAARRAGAMGRLTTGFLPPMLIVGVICALVGREDLGTAVLIGAVAVAMLVAGGVKLWQAALLLPMGFLAAIGAIITSPYRLNRLHAFVDAYQDPQGIGYHVLQSMSAVAGGGLAGRGLGNSVQKFGYLPEATTDFIFAIICEEMGIVGAAVVILLYAALLLCGLSIVMRKVNVKPRDSHPRALTATAPITLHPFQRLLGFGILLTIGLQALINLAVVTGTAPTKGIALPLLSSGGTGWILTAFCIGLIISMDRELAQAEAALEAEDVDADLLLMNDAGAVSSRSPSFQV